MLGVRNYFRRPIDVPEKTETKGFKVTNASRTRKVGIACRSLEELKEKASIKLKISEKLEDISVFLLDGSEIDNEYFLTLKPQTILIVHKPGERVKTDADLLYETLRRVNVEFLTTGDQITKFLSDNLKAKIAILNGILNKDDSKTYFSSRTDHPEWFRGLGPNFTSKEAYMHRRCQDRMRGYLFKAEEQIKSSEIFTTNRRARQNLLRAIAFFRLQLKEDHYNGHYFDRSKVNKVKIENENANANEGENETDETDSASNSCYDHCPCKLNTTDYLSFFEIESDQVDAKRIKQVDEEDLQWYYKITPSKERKLITLCDQKGEFKCDGVWNKDQCMYEGKHRINPYRSKEEVILFSTWNLDHRIERSRTLVPQLLELSQEETLSEKDVVNIYENLFTVKNLRLVHIVCHDKGAHK
ncbi:DNA fragmentation factor subunit beta [Belonocnema kinseyi]|uniref:DNA fragmentation factor subunit beta n=1 Tax=Belonocnema kinseyi TaxID=2817044 RepID=UPI00143CDF52|nr:DNA fragmentation factor subunit beta [Belonocnema kinseyi]